MRLHIDSWDECKDFYFNEKFEFANPEGHLRPKASCRKLTKDCTLVHGDSIFLLSWMIRLGIKPGLIYGDPPYNTQNKFKNYDDRMEMDKWCTAFKVRMLLCHEALANDGVLVIQLDSYAAAYAEIILDEIFGLGFGIPPIVWKRSRSRNSMSGDICKMHDTLLVYKKSKSTKFNKLPHSAEYVEKVYNRDDDDGRGAYNLVNLYNHANTNKMRPLVFPAKTHSYWKKHPELAHHAGRSLERKWFCAQKTLTQRFDEDTVVINLDKDNEVTVVYKKDYLSTKDGQTPTTWWDDCGTNNDGTKELYDVFGNGNKVFDTAKAPQLMDRIIKLYSNEGDLVFDPYLGSGSTLSAALRAGRKAIGCDLIKDNIVIAEEKIRNTVNDKFTIKHMSVGNEK